MITLRLDKNGGINKGDIKAFKHDNLSEVYVIQLYKNSAIYDLTNKTVELTIVEKKRKLGDMISLPIYEAIEGKVKLEVVSAITKQDGIFDFKLTVKDTTGLIETFPNFQVKIENDITDSITGEIIQDQNFTILVDGLKALADYNIYKTNALKVPEIEKDIVDLTSQLDSIETEIPYKPFSKGRPNINNFGEYKDYINGHLMVAKKTYGILENGAVASVIANEENPRAEILGVSVTSDLTKYEARDSVGLYVHNKSRSSTLKTNDGTYTSNTVTLPKSYDLSKVLPGMIIDTLHTPNKFTTIIESVDYDNNIITVKDGWYKIISGGSTTPEIPPSGVGLEINRITKIWGINNNVFITEGCENGVAEEIGVFTQHSNIGSVGGIDLVNFLLSSHFGYRARGVLYGFQKAFLSEKSGVHFSGEQSDSNSVLLQSINTDGSSFFIKNSGQMSELNLGMQVVSTSTNFNPNMSIALIITPGITLTLPQPKKGKIIKIVVQGNPTIENKTKLLTHDQQAYIRFPSLAFPEIPFTKNGYCELVGDGASWYALSSTIYNG